MEEYDDKLWENYQNELALTWAAFRNDEAHLGFPEEIWPYMEVAFRVAFHIGWQHALDSSVYTIGLVEKEEEE